VTIEIPDEVLNSDLSLTAKLIVATSISHPHLSKVELTRVLGTNRSSVFKAIKKAKEGGVYNETGSVPRDTNRVTLDTPYLVRKLEVGEEGTKTLNATTPPTKEEVAKYGAELGAAGSLVTEFFTTYEERGWMSNGEPIRSWKKMLGWWVRNKKPAPNQTKTKPSISAEEARYLMDAAS